MKKLNYIIIILFFFTAKSAYPDKLLIFPEGTGLETCVRQNIPTTYALPLRENDIINLKILKCRLPDVTSLEGIDQLINLEEIYINRDSTVLSDLTPLSLLPKLSKIEIKNSKVTSIAPLNVLNLHHLNLSNSHVADLTPLAGMDTLETLIMYRQSPDYIQDITPLANLTKLTAIDLSSNKITDITPLSGLTELNYINMRDNRITSLEPLRPLTALRAVNFNINDLTDAGVFGASAEFLSVLDVANNKLSTIAFLVNTPNVEYLNVTGNQINDISPVNNLQKPRRLIFDRNDLTILAPVQDIIEKGRVYELSVSFNCISDFDSIALQRVKYLRKNGNCEAKPAYSEYDLLGVVNWDLISGVSQEGEVSFPEDDPIAQNIINDQKSPGGCSMGGEGGIWGWISPIAAAAAWIFIRRAKTAHTP